MKMALKRPVKLKITGLARDVDDTIRGLQQIFIVSRTSKTIPHNDNDESHAYVMLIQEAS